MSYFREFKEFYDCLDINLLEISYKFKKIQQKKISNNKEIIGGLVKLIRSDIYALKLFIINSLYIKSHSIAM